MNYFTRQEQLLFIDIDEEIGQEFETLSTIFELPDLEKSGGGSSCASENNTRLAAVNSKLHYQRINFNSGGQGSLIATKILSNDSFIIILTFSLLFKILPLLVCNNQDLEGFIFFCYLKIYGTINQQKHNAGRL